jgi:hypothetical protein
VIKVHIGETVRVTLPYSEVCMYMRVAGTDRFVNVTAGGMAQILTWEGGRFGGAITLGEAGLTLCREVCGECGDCGCGCEDDALYARSAWECLPSGYPY